GDPAQARRDADRDRGRPGTHLPGRAPQAGGPPPHRGGSAGQALRKRRGAAPDRRGDPGAGRLRLYEGVPRRALLPRREGDGDLRGHERDPAARDRAGALGFAVVTRKPDEPVRLTRIYTRGGDAGETSLGDGSRVSKLDPLVKAYGAVDELNSLLGWARVEAGARLERLQNELFDLGADLSVPYAPGDGKLRVTQAYVDRLEADCDEANAPLPGLKSFVLPGGNE